MIKIKLISIERIEGPYSAAWPAGMLKEFTSLKAANEELSKLCWAMNRISRGYDKVDFKVVWEDGVVHSGRFDATHPEAPGHERCALGARMAAFSLADKGADWVAGREFGDHS